MAMNPDLDPGFGRRHEVRLMVLDLVKHVLWALIAVFAIYWLSAAVRDRGGAGDVARLPAASDPQPAPGAGADPQRLRAAAREVEARARARGLGAGVKLDAGEIWGLLTPLVASGKVAPETASDLVKNLVQGGREITVDTVSQLLEKALRDKPATPGPGPGAGGERMVQTCAPTLTVQAPPPIVAPPPPACPSDKIGERG